MKAFFVWYYMSIKCSVSWCDRKSENSDGYCKKHHHHIERYGRIKQRTTRDPNEVRPRNGYYEIDMYDKNSDITGTMLISDEHYCLVKGKKIVLAKNGYPCIKDGNTIKMVHKIILPVSNGNYVDHINHIKTDNRIDNLREVTPTQSAQNIYAIGARYDKTKERWIVSLKVNGIRKYIGTYKIKEEAIQKYREATKIYYGEYAYRYQEEACL